MKLQSTAHFTPRGQLRAAEVKEEARLVVPLSCARTLYESEFQPYHPPLRIRAASFACPPSLIMGEGLAFKDSIMYLMYLACTWSQSGQTCTHTNEGQGLLFLSMFFCSFLLVHAESNRLSRISLFKSTPSLTDRTGLHVFPALNIDVVGLTYHKRAWLMGGLTHWRCALFHH